MTGMTVVIDNYFKNCKTTTGSIKKIYLLPYVKYSRALVKTSGMSLIEFPNSIIYVFEVRGNYTQSSKIENGAISFDHNVSIQLFKVYDEIDIHDFLKVDFRVIVETENDQLIMFGVRNGLTAKTSNSSGASENEFNGFSLDFTGQEEKAGVLISSLADLGLEVYDPLIFLNYDLNFDI
jgi:hypothetical protein